MTCDRFSHIPFAFGEDAEGEECEDDGGGEVGFAEVEEDEVDGGGDPGGEQAVADAAQEDEYGGADEEMVLTEVAFDGAVDIVAIDDEQRGGEGGCDKWQVRFEPGRERDKECFNRFHIRERSIRFLKWARLNCFVILRQKLL